MRFWNAPNTVCVVRTALIPISIVLLYFGTYLERVIGVILILLSFMLDAVDGWLARKLKEETTIGSLIDVIADRITEYMLWIFFSGMKLIPLWAPLIVIPRGVMTDFIRSIAVAKGISVYSLPKSRLSKFLVSNRIPRILIGGGKLLLFVVSGAIISGIVSGPQWTSLVYWLTVLVVVINIARGLPVIVESGKVLS